MKRFAFTSLVFILLLYLCGSKAFAHVPYLEKTDFSEESPFEILKSIRQSLAVYAWLEFESYYTEDIDVYVFQVRQPLGTNVFIESLVPVCPGYEDFLPWFAVVGPGLPDPGYKLPFDIPEGYGAIVVENYMPGEDRPQFYEPFGGKSYYEGPEFEQKMDPGIYYVYFWDPYEMGGDYVAVFGDLEMWGIKDILRALIVTPMIRNNEELHIDCE
jgi:hypothetical protein